MTAVEQARELLHWTEKYEHAKHMLRRLKEIVVAYHRDLMRARNELQRARANMLVARCHMHAARWVKIRDASFARIRFHIRRYQQELAE